MDDATDRKLAATNGKLTSEGELRMARTAVTKNVLSPISDTTIRPSDLTKASQACSNKKTIVGGVQLIGGTKPVNSRCSAMEFPSASLQESRPANLVDGSNQIQRSDKSTEETKYETQAVRSIQTC